MTEMNYFWRNIRHILRRIAFLILKLLIWVTDRGCLAVFVVILERVFVFYDNRLLNGGSLVYAALSHESIQRRYDVIFEKTALAHIFNKFLQSGALYNFGTFHD